MIRDQALEQLSQLCRNGHHAELPSATEPSGSAALDRFLPGGGWLVGTIVELMPMQAGIGELRLLMPTLARITNADRYVALVAPPYVPFAPALLQHGVRLERMLIMQALQAADILWTFEQTLRCRSFGAVLAWPATIKDREVRRLQLAAAAGNSIGFLYRPAAAALQASAAAVRMKLLSDPQGGLHLDILKCRGGRSGVVRNATDRTAAGDADSPPPLSAR
jgi:cell division inhibitor SulA/protein ImuA